MDVITNEFENMKVPLMPSNEGYMLVLSQSQCRREGMGLTGHVARRRLTVYQPSGCVHCEVYKIAHREAVILAKAARMESRVAAYGVLLGIWLVKPR